MEPRLSRELSSEHAFFAKESTMKSLLRQVLLCLIVFCAPAMAQNTAPLSLSTSTNLVSAHAPVLPAPRPVARVNGAVLTDRDLLREMYTIFPYAKQHNGGFPRAMEADIRRGALKMIEFEELAYQEARRRRMTIVPERLAASEKQFRQQFGNEQQYESFLQTEAGASRQVVRTKIERSLLIEDFLKEEVAGKSEVSVAEAKAFYVKNPGRFEVPETYAMQTISILPPRARSAKQAAASPATPEELKQMRARAEAALKQAKTTRSYEEFGLLAEKISEDDYRVMMGDHRAVKAAEMPPEILAAASKMHPGEVSSLLQAEGVFTIVRLNAHNPSRMQPFGDAEPVLRAQLRSSKAERVRRELDARLRKNAKIEEL
jgi:parvulin-like peptidyl-prolyl isomerase